MLLARAHTHTHTNTHRLEPFLRSEPEPADNTGPVKVIVGTHARTETHTNERARARAHTHTHTHTHQQTTRGPVKVVLFPFCMCSLQGESTCGFVYTCVQISRCARDVVWVLLHARATSTRAPVA